MGDHGYRWGREKGRPGGFDGCLGWQAKGFGGLRKGSGKVRWSEREAGKGDLGNW